MKSYLSLIKFAHTVFALPFAFLAFFMGMKSAELAFNLRLMVLIVLCMVFARTAAMAFNRYVDRHIDALNNRTLIREIPSGVIKPGSALILVILMSLAFIFTTFWINPLCFYLSPVALLVILGYSYTKRITWLCHFILGLGLGLAPVGAFIAVTGEFEWLPVLYGIMVLFWVSGFDILYALQDEDFDRQNGLHSVPQAFGQKTARHIAIFIHSLCGLLLFFITRYQAELFPTLGFLHWIAAAGFAALLGYQHFLVYKYDLLKIDRAFFETNGFASICFGTVVIVDVLF
jgi:4-hydroxybenzoate polyprenyltransferase